ncbi:MAG: PDZ domain-containing protein, partial [Chitinophagaceae bacterium]
SLNQTLPTLRLGKVAEVKNEYGFIRSTCKMEPGDSGGPLFDYHGRVIGLHSAIDVGEDQNFEIPVDLYRKYWTALKKEMSYSSLPVLQDSVGQDPLALKLITERKQKKLHPKLAASTKNISCLSIESSINSEQQQILATLFNYIDTGNKKRQFLVTKQSMLGEKPSLTSFRDVTLVILARDKENDLALLEVKQPIKGGINLNEVSSDTQSISMGKLISTVKENGSLANSFLGSDIFMLPKISSMPYLGAKVMFNSKPAQFSLIDPKSPAAAAGLMVGDELIAINNQKIDKASSFAPEIMKFWPGDEITLNWKNDEGTSLKKVILADLKPTSSNHPVERFEGGKSKRRDGFEKVFAHDAAIKPTECGSPVFNINEAFVGINIARFSRAATLAIPASEIFKFIY